MKVFLTGATSLLGRTVALQLLERGDQVTTFQRQPSGLDTTEILGDLRDPSAIASAARGHDSVIHLAALVTPRPSWEDAVAVNVDGTGCRTVRLHLIALRCLPRCADNGRGERHRPLRRP